MNQEYDNSNKGAAWNKRDGKIVQAAVGQADIGERRYYLSIVQTGKDKPSHNLFLIDAQDRTVHGSALFREQKNPNRLLQGDITLPHGEFWVSVFRNASQHPQSPLLDFRFSPKEPQPDVAPPQRQQRPPQARRRQPPQPPQEINEPFVPEATGEPAYDDQGGYVETPTGNDIPF